MHIGLIAVLVLLFLGPLLWISYQAFIKLGCKWMLLLLPLAWFIGLLFGAFAAMLLTGLLQWLSNRNTPPPEPGSMGGVAWLGIWLVGTLILSPLCAAIFTWLTAKFFLHA
ncbi:hypothetical protein [Scytonema sp. NUACC21]